MDRVIIKMSFLFYDTDEDTKWKLRKKLLHICKRVIVVGNHRTQRTHVSVIVDEMKKYQVINVIEKITRENIIVISHNE